MAVEQLTFQGGEEALSHGVVQRVADGAHRGDQTGLLEAAAEGQAGVLGGFKWSSQHLDSEGLRWEQGSVEQLLVAVVRRCGRRAVHRWAT